jgi:hypothetical protein
MRGLGADFLRTGSKPNDVLETAPKHALATGRTGFSKAHFADYSFFDSQSNTTPGK